MSCINQIKGNHECSNTVAYILPAVPNPPHHDVGVKRSKFLFLRTWSCCISNQMKSRMQQHGSKYFARRTPPPTLGVKRSKINLFWNNVTLNIKLKESKMQQLGCKRFPPDPQPPDPDAEANRSKFNFSEHGCVTYQFKEMTNSATWLQIFCLQTPRPWP